MTYEQFIAWLTLEGYAMFVFDGGEVRIAKSGFNSRDYGVAVGPMYPWKVRLGNTAEYKPTSNTLWVLHNPTYQKYVVEILEGL